MKIQKDLSEALNSDSEAGKIFNALPPSHQNEYVKWISEAKKSDTRIERIKKTLSLLKSGGKKR